MENRSSQSLGYAGRGSSELFPSASFMFMQGGTGGPSGSNGDTIQVTITVLAAGNESQNQQVNGTELFLVESTQGSGSSALSHIWWGLVGS